MNMSLENIYHHNANANTMSKNISVIRNKKYGYENEILLPLNLPTSTLLMSYLKDLVLCNNHFMKVSTFIVFLTLCNFKTIQTNRRKGPIYPVVNEIITATVILTLSCHNIVLKYKNLHARIKVGASETLTEKCTDLLILIVTIKFNWSFSGIIGSVFVGGIGRCLV